MKRLLLYTDREDVRRDLTRLIDTIPEWEIVCVSESEAAWGTFRERVPALVINDLDLVGTQRIDRWMDLVIKPLVVFFSNGVITPHHLEQVKFYSAFDYLTLPLDIDRIMFAIRVANKDA